MIECVDELDGILLCAGGNTFGGAYIQNGIARVAEARAGIHAGQETAAPARRAAADATAGAHHNKARQVPRLRAEAVGNPRTHAGSSWLREARVHVNLRWGVVELGRTAGLHNGDVVHDGREMR